MDLRTIGKINILILVHLFCIINSIFIHIQHNLDLSSNLKINLYFINNFLLFSLIILRYLRGIFEKKPDIFL